jgi:hypothetical protein
VASVYDKQLMAICFTNVPLLKVIPKREDSYFAKKWKMKSLRLMFFVFPSAFCWLPFEEAAASRDRSQKLI